MTIKLDAFLKISFKRIAFISPSCVGGLILIWLLTGCGGDASGGKQTVFSQDITPSGATFYVDNRFGDDSSDGIAQPYQSLQYALDQLRPGDKLIIIDSGVPYTSPDNQAFVLNISGTESANIIIQGENAKRPVIDQGKLSAQDHYSALGLLLDCVSYVVIRNLEIKNVHEAGISSSTSGSCETSHITIENSYIHHVYGGSYVGGIRMMGVSDLTIRGNTFSDILSSSEPKDRLISRSGRGISNINIENNSFILLDSGVVINGQGVGYQSFYLNSEEQISNIEIKNNSFDEVKSAISFHSQVSDRTEDDDIKIGLLRSVDISGNLFYKPSTAVNSSLGESAHQSERFCIFNNTFVEASSKVISFEGVEKIEIFNNIFFGSKEEILITKKPSNSSLINGISYSNYNLFSGLYSDYTNLQWRLDVGGSNAYFSSLSEWSSAGHHPELEKLSGVPDSQSKMEHPRFSSTAIDFSIEDNSPAFLNGRYGVNIGYDFIQPADFQSQCRSFL